MVSFRQFGKDDDFQGSHIKVIAELNYLLIFYVPCGILSSLAIVGLYFHIYRMIVNQVMKFECFIVKFKIYITFQLFCVVKKKRSEIVANTTKSTIQYIKEKSELVV